MLRDFRNLLIKNARPTITAWSKWNVKDGEEDAVSSLRIKEMVGAREELESVFIFIVGGQRKPEETEENWP